MIKDNQISTGPNGVTMNNTLITLSFQINYTMTFTLRINAFAFSSGDEQITVGTDDNKIFMYDLSTVLEIGNYMQSCGPTMNDLKYSVNDKFLACSKNRSLEIWSLENRTLQRTIKFDKGNLMFNGLAQDWSSILTKSRDYIYIWKLDKSSEPKLHKIITLDIGHHLCYSSNGRYFLSLINTRNMYQLVSIQTGRKSQKNFHGSKVEFSHNSQMVASICYRKLKLYNFNTGKLLRSSPQFNDIIIIAQFKQDDQSIISWSTNALIKQWSIVDGKLQILRAQIVAHNFSRNGKYTICNYLKELRIQKYNDV